MTRVLQSCVCFPHGMKQVAEIDRRPNRYWPEGRALDISECKQCGGYMEYTFRHRQSEYLLGKLPPHYPVPALLVDVDVGPSGLHLMQLNMVDGSPMWEQEYPPRF